MKQSIIHVPAPPPFHFPCWAGCKCFTGFRGRTWPSRDSQDGAAGSFTLFWRQERTQPQAWGVGGWPWHLWPGGGVGSCPLWTCSPSAGYTV